MAVKKQNIENLNFNGKSVMITGSTGGLGSVLAKNYLKLGANLILLAKDVKNQNLQFKELSKIKSKNQFIKTLNFNLKSNELYSELNKNLEDFSNVDVLINNAAIHGPIGFFKDNNIEDWKEAFQVNFFSTIEIIHLIIPFMIKKNKGKIINISGGGASGSRPGYTSYAIAKTGLVRFTEILAEELIRYNIQINIVAPGMMPTKLLSEVKNSKLSSKKECDNADKTFNSKNAFKNVTKMCNFLSSSQSDNITGKFLSAKWDNIKDIINYNDDINTYKLRRTIP